MTRNAAPAIDGINRRQESKLHTFIFILGIFFSLATLQTYVTDDRLTGISAVGSDSVSKAAS